MTVIRTTYATHPGSNNGDIRATAHGSRAVVRIDPALYMVDNHRRAAEKLAAKLGLTLSGEAIADDRPSRYRFPTIAPWPADVARELRATAWRMFSDHGHGSHWDKLTREACGTCALNGYHDRAIAREESAPVAPNYAGWARLYIQAGRPIPAKYADGFRAELANDNIRYVDALRRDIVTFGGWEL